MVLPKKMTGLAALVGSLTAVANAFSPSTPPISALRPVAVARISPPTPTALLAECTLDGETIRGPITPLGNFALVRTKDALTATDGGILLPDQSTELVCEGEVLSAGPGKLHPHTGVRITNPVGEGVSVLYGEYAGTAMVYNDEQVTMIRDDDIMLSYKGTQMTRDNVVPCRDYVLIKLENEKLETASGIVVAASVTKDQAPCEGLVVKVGEGRLGSLGEFSPSPCQVGDQVKFKDYGGNDVKIQGGSYSIVRMIDILCSVVEDEAP